ncbi:hypothetical protein BH23CHL5_BH23CHL5_20120 [soil metagenome]
MVMRMPRILRSDNRFEADEVMPKEGSIWPVREPATILPWPATTQLEQTAETPIAVTIRTKHFTGHTGSEVREYGAKLETRGTAPADLIRTLTRVIQETPELLEAPPCGSPVILDIRVVAG